MKKLISKLLSILMIVSCVCLNANVSVYADTYTVSFNANGGSGTMDSVSASDSYTYPSCTFTAPEGKSFFGWSTSSTGSVAKSSTISADTTLYAIWLPSSSSHTGCEHSDATVHFYSTGNTYNYEESVVAVEGRCFYDGTQDLYDGSDSFVRLTNIANNGAAGWYYSTDGQTYLSCSSSTPSTVSTTYVNAAGVAQDAVDCTPITSSTTTLGTADTETWYVSNGDDVTADSLTVTGDVNLILVDGKTLTVTEGITLSDGASLTIYGQSSGTGKLVTKKVLSDASATTGSITVNGGIVEATNVDNKSAFGAPIVNIVNGTVKANSNSYALVATSEINISGGIVEANGYYGIVCSGYINISGGKINAKGETNTPHDSVGILAYYDLNITGGTVVSTAVCNDTNYQNIAMGIQATNVKISAGNLTSASTGSENNYCLGIVGTNSVEITGGTTKAKGVVAAVYSGSPLTIDVPDTMSITGAEYGILDGTYAFIDGGSYKEGETTALKNIDTGYVTISSSTPTTTTGGSDSGYTAPKTCVE